MSRWDCFLLISVAIFMIFLSGDARKKFIKEVIVRVKAKQGV